MYVTILNPIRRLQKFAAPSVGGKYGTPTRITTNTGGVYAGQVSAHL